MQESVCDPGYSHDYLAGTRGDQVTQGNAAFDACPFDDSVAIDVAFHLQILAIPRDSGRNAV